MIIGQHKFSRGHKVSFMTANKINRRRYQVARPTYGRPRLLVGFLPSRSLRARHFATGTASTVTLILRPTSVRIINQRERRRSPGRGPAMLKKSARAHLRPPHIRYESVERRQLSFLLFYERNRDVRRK